MVYFSGTNENEVPERDFMWAILQTEMPSAIKSPIENARKQRTQDGEQDQEQMVEVDTEIFKFMQEVSAQKRKQIY